MGDFREKLNFSPVSFVDYGGSNSSGAAVTTAADGSPTYSVDDDALPLNFFDAKSGEFVDSPQARSIHSLNVARCVLRSTEVNALQSQVPHRVHLLAHLLTMRMSHTHQLKEREKQRLLERDLDLLRNTVASLRREMLINL